MDLNIETISISSTEDFESKTPGKNQQNKRILRKRKNGLNKEVKIESKSRILRRAERDVKKELLTPKISNYFPKSKSTRESKLKQDEHPSVYYYEKKGRGKSSEIQRKICPDYKIIAGTTFGVDSFRFGIIEGITHYFLTHFHSDHYIGLTKNFDRPLFVSGITGRLVKRMINVGDRYINVVKLNEPFVINGTEITAIDANHCPGAVMFFFKLPNGRTILHTGDFRACHEMESEPIFWNYDIDLIYLDTTYLSSKYIFKTQYESVKAAQDHVLEFGKKFNWQNILIVCGSYLIGKEKVWTNIAEYFNLKVWMDSNRRKVLDCIDDKRLLNLVTDSQNDASIHVLPINKLHYELLNSYLKHFDQFENLLALVPSGWQKNNTRPIVRGHITIIGIEYSEHSSYDELKRFIKFVRPKNVISTVPHGSDLMKTPNIPKSWLDEDVNVKRKGYQKSISNYVKILPNLPLDDKTNNKHLLERVDEVMNNNESNDCVVSVCEAVLHDSTIRDGDNLMNDSCDSLTKANFENNVAPVCGNEEDILELANEFDWMF